MSYEKITLVPEGLDVKPLRTFCASSEAFVFIGFVKEKSSEGVMVRPEGSGDNAVVDMEFHIEDSNVIYAATFGSGVYLSPNQAGEWLNLGTPEYKVFAISSGSLYAATEGGVYQCTGTGVIAGDVTDDYDQSGIDGATVFNDLGPVTISVNGEYMMVSPFGMSPSMVGGSPGLAVDFGTHGLCYYDGLSWNSLSGWDPQDICEVDLY